MKLKLLLVVLAAGQGVLAQTSGTPSNVPRPGLKEVQVPFASLKSSATLKVGKLQTGSLQRTTPFGSRVQSPIPSGESIP